jgi:hypothetical protein
MEKRDWIQATSAYGKMSWNFSCKPIPIHEVSDYFPAILPVAIDQFTAVWNGSRVKALELSAVVVDATITSAAVPPYIRRTAEDECD